jgi:GTP cyclohydrolase I
MSLPLQFDPDNAALRELQGIEPFARVDAENAVLHLLTALGQDVTREGLRDTPARVASYLAQMLVPEPFEFTTFDAEGMSEMIVQADIPFYSLCEHHLLPFYGKATVAYVPSGRIVGLSKLARAVRHCAAGLQNQERVTRNVADLLMRKLQPAGVGVVLRAEHLCMSIRGVQAPGVLTTTSCLTGPFLEDARCRAEFMALAGVRA